MSKRKELELLISQQKAELERLTSRLADQDKLLQEYRQREKAVIEALTKAQAVADDIIKNANDRLAQANQDAEVIIQHAKEEADKVLQAAMDRADEKLTAATGRAAKIVEDAQREATRRLAQTEASAKAYQENIDAVNAELKQTAELARNRAEAFAQFIEQLMPAGNAEFAAEGQGLSALLAAQPVETPEEYENPAELMKSIYAIQGRNAEPASYSEEPDTETEAVDADEADDVDEPDEADGVDEQDEPDEADETDEQVWSVDKVLSQAQVEQVEDNPLIKELESIIDGVFEEDEVDAPGM